MQQEEQGQRAKHGAQRVAAQRDVRVERARIGKARQEASGCGVPLLAFMTGLLLPTPYFRVQTTKRHPIHRPAGSLIESNQNHRPLLYTDPDNHRCCMKR